MNLAYAFRDLGKQKTRTSFGISGIAISIFLLSVIGMLGDSVSYSYVDYASQQAGKIDYNISGGYIPTAVLESKIKQDPVLAQELHDFLPRNVRWIYNNEIITTSNITDPKRMSEDVLNIGVDIARENAAITKFLLADGSPFTGTLGAGQCLITQQMAKDMGVVAGDQIIYNRTVYTTSEKKVVSYYDIKTYTVVAVVSFNFKFPSYVENAVILNLSRWISTWGGYQGYSSDIVVNLASPQSYYDAKDITGTINRLRKIGERIQNCIGFYNDLPKPDTPQNTTFTIDMPRISVLEIAQYVNVGISIILLFVTILGVVISGVLINGILTTSVEEKIREFGVFRVLGAHSKIPIKLTVLQAFIVSSIGTAIGIGGGYAMVRFALLPVLQRFLNFTAGQVVAFMSAQTLGLTLGVGIGVSMLVGIAPALRVSRMSILAAINPYRQESVGTRMVKEGNANGKLVLLGGVVSGIAAFVLFIVPQIILTLDLGLIVGVLIIMLSVFLLGATLVGLGLLPVIQGIIMRVFTFLARKTKDIIRISLTRYSRRNVTTVIMFSIAFSFITLVSTVIGTQSAQNTGTIRNTNGTDMVIDSRRNFISGFDPDSSVLLPDTAFARELLSYAPIVKTSAVLATNLELGVMRKSQHTITLKDLVGYKTSSVHGWAIDENYLDVVYQEYVVFSQGSSDAAFHQVLHGTGNVIISSALSTSLLVGLGDKCVLQFQWGDGEVHAEQFTIVGVVDNLPGIYTVQKRPDSASGAAIVLNQADYKRCFQLPAGDYYTSRIFIKLREDYRNRDKSGTFEQQLVNQYKSTYNFRISGSDYSSGQTRPVSFNSYRQGGFAQEIFAIVEALFTIILTFAVIISLFGLTSGSYSTILERTREVGIIETLGLRKRSVGNMFTLESEIIMTSAAINGSIIGLILVWLFYSQIAAFSTFPVMSVFSIPYGIIAIELGVAALVCFFSMKGLVKNVQRMELIDIFRKTL
ncbi:MAG: ABC transporter permease [Candidatus Lokiarchaeota archaeon]|nr:ABC transporter permease [Candidatus Lokiarchaeota archaeon]